MGGLCGTAVVEETSSSSGEVVAGNTGRKKLGWGLGSWIPVIADADTTWGEQDGCCAWGGWGGRGWGGGRCGECGRRLVRASGERVSGRGRENGGSARFRGSAARRTGLTKEHGGEADQQ